MSESEMRKRRAAIRAAQGIAVCKGSIHDDHDLEVMTYFLSRPIEERIGAVEELRKAMHGDDYETKLGLSRSDIRIQRRSR